MLRVSISFYVVNVSNVFFICLQGVFSAHVLFPTADSIGRAFLDSPDTLGYNFRHCFSRKRNLPEQIALDRGNTQALHAQQA